MMARRGTIPALLLGFGASHCGVEEDIVARRLSATGVGGNEIGGRTGSDGTAMPQAGGSARNGTGGRVFPTYGGSVPFGQGATAGGGAAQGGVTQGGVEAGGRGGAPSSARGGAATCEGAAFVSTAQSSTPTRDTCPAWAARRSFAHALCSCGDVDLGRGLVSTTLDSSDSERDIEGSAAVGIDGQLSKTDSLRIDGSLTIAGTRQLTSSGSVDVAGDLRLAGSATSAGPIFVGRDAWLAGNTSSLSLLEIERDLHVDPEIRVMSFGPPRVGGERYEESFASAPPCACAPNELLDVPGIVSDGVARNDNARIALALDALESESAPAELTLSCGRFALRAISGTASVTVRVEGAATLFVDGNVELGPDFVLELGPLATLDWFVRGTVSLAPESRIGDAARPGALRLYTTEAFDLTLPGNDDVSMSLYAPQADVAVGGQGVVYGALFAGSVTTRSTLLINYDVSVLENNAACASLEPNTCSRCDDCVDGTACMEGTCGACATDADCCFPLVCGPGGCAPLGAGS
jgi:hypothetical protein